jgi:hypothetical protein
MPTRENSFVKPQDSRSVNLVFLIRQTNQRKYQGQRASSRAKR